MACTKNKIWDPSAAFLIKCAKEKEKLRLKFQRQLQEQMLFMLNEELYTDTLVGVNASQNLIADHNAHYSLPVHEPILKVRTPGFLEHIKKYEEENSNATFYQSFLCKSELKEFIKKVYTDDDIRKHECEAVRLSRTYYDILNEHKIVVNKNVLDGEEFEGESVTSTGTENYLTPKTSPVTPEKQTDVFNMFQAKQKSLKHQDSVNLNKANSKLDQVAKRDSSEDYISELDNPNYEEDDAQLDRCSLKRSVSAFINHMNADVSSTSVDIDESDFVLDDICSPISGEILSSLGLDSDELATDVSITSGMVRSNTFDLQTQAPLEDFLDSKCEEHIDNGYIHVDQANNLLRITSREFICDNELIDNTSFFLHDKVTSPQLIPNKRHNIFPNMNPSTENVAQPTVQLRRNDGSMTDSGFMSYSMYSMLSESGLQSSASGSMMIPEGNNNTNQELKQETKLEKCKRLSGSMFPFYIDMNSLPHDRKNYSKEEKRNSSPVYMFIDSESKSDACPVKSSGPTDLPLRYNRDLHRVQLSKAQSSPHLDSCRDMASSPRRSIQSRPQSCYMYIDLDSVNQSKTDSPRKTARAPSSVSMYVDLNSGGDSVKASEKENGNFYSLLNSKDSNENVKLFNANDDTSVIRQRRKLSDPFLPPQDPESSRMNFFSLRKSAENRSDSALNHLARRAQAPESKIYDFPKRNYALQNSRSMPKTTELLYLNHAYLQKQKMEATTSNFNHTELNALRTSSSSSTRSENSRIQDPIRMLEKHLNNHVPDSSFPQLDSMKQDSPYLEPGLLPMSPILRKKNPKKEAPKPAPPPVKIKSSTRPQDIDAMRFPRSIDLSTKIPLNLDTQVADSQSSKKRLENVKLDVEYISENGDGRFGPIEPTSRSESSAPTMSGETSSDKPFANLSRDRMQSPVSFSLPYDFDNDGETIYSEVSDLSSSLGATSGVSSLERRWHEGYNIVKDVSAHGIHNMYRMLEACSKLGEDLLRMFLEEIDTDVVIQVEGKEIKAHRCILCSRCRYFATVLRRDNPDSGDLNFQGFTYASVHFALCHIYSGAMNLPKDINLVELAILADVLGLDTLIDVIVLHLKTRFCHFFHKPCLHCVQGVIECLPIVVSCGFTNLQEKCIHWLGRYFTRTWTNKGFAALPNDIREQCFQSAVKLLAVESVIEITLSCDRIITTLPHMKWAEPVFGMVTGLLQECIHYIAEHFDRILCSEGFLVLGKGHSWNVSALEDDIMSAIELMAPDVACKSCVKLNQILTLSDAGGCSEYGEFTHNFVDLLHKVSRHCERYLIHNANKVAHCQNWACLPPEVQKRIKDAAVIVFEFEKPSARPPRLSSLQKKTKKLKESEDTNIERSTFPKPVRTAKRNINESYDKTFCIPAKSEEDKKHVEQRRELDHMSKKIVSPIKEESHANCLDSKKELFDVHDEDSLKEMQELPHDHSTAQNVFDVSQYSSSAGLLESEENRSGTHCSDNPDSLDANDDLLSDSKEDMLASIQSDLPSNDKQLNTDTNENDISNSNNNYEEFNITNEESLSSDCLNRAPMNKVPPLPEDKPKKHLDVSRIPRSPVKSYVPLPKPHNHNDKETMNNGNSQCKDLVAEIDADSRMVTHCLQEAEMLEQQLSRKLQHQHQSSLVSKSRFEAASDVRRSSSTSLHLQKSSSTNQMRTETCRVPTTRGKSPAKLNNSPSSSYAQRVSRPMETNKDLKMATKKVPQFLKTGVPVQRTFKSTENNSVSHQEVAVAKRVPTRLRSRPVIANVRDGRNAPK